MTQRFFKYVWNITSENGTYLDVVRDYAEYDRRQGADTVRWFKGFGKCYRKDHGAYTKFYSECNGNFHEEHYYDSLGELIRGENLELVPLQVGKNSTQKSFYGKAWVIRDKNGINKGLKSFDELVATFHAGEYIQMLGYFSQTTTRHQDAYLFPTLSCYKLHGNVDKLTKKVLDQQSRFYFAS